MLTSADFGIDQAEHDQLRATVAKWQSDLARSQRREPPDRSQGHDREQPGETSTQHCAVAVIAAGAVGEQVRNWSRCSEFTRQRLEIFARGAYTAPISPETRKHATERVGTQWDENPMDTRVSAIAEDRARSLGIGFH